MRKAFKIPSQYLARRKEDPQLQRMASCVNTKTSAAEEVHILGYACERGVRFNLGREGAAKGPAAIRQILYRMPLNKSLSICDHGDFSGGQSLEKLHGEAHEYLKKLRAKGQRIVTIGGGHDWAAVDGDFEDQHIIHIDTHLDVRPPLKGSKRHSGMPFRYLVEKGASIYCMGPQKIANATEHWDWAQKHFKKLWSLSELQENSDQILKDLQGTLKNKKNIYLSIDLDAFSQAISPGVSAPSTLGIEVDYVFKLLNCFRDQISHLGIYEMNPIYDRDSQSARLAATLINSYLCL